MHIGVNTHTHIYIYICVQYDQINHQTIKGFSEVCVVEERRYQDRHSTYTENTCTIPIFNDEHMGLSENSVPLHPMVNDHYPY